MVSNVRKGLPRQVLGDVAKEPVFDLIPLTGSGWEVANANAQPGLIGELLEFMFPGMRAIPIATARIGCDE